MNTWIDHLSAPLVIVLALLAVVALAARDERRLTGTETRAALGRLGRRAWPLALLALAAAVLRVVLVY